MHTHAPRSRRRAETPEPGVRSAKQAPVDKTHEDLAREHNVREHARHQVATTTDERTRGDDTLEPWADYDLEVMPRGV